jgi:GNAT superfamily N-acetyltransferase
MKDEWGKFLKRRGIVAESYTSKQQVIDHFVRSARKRGEDVNLAAQKGAGAWERGWRGPKSKQPKPYDPESYKNVRLPYVDEDGVEEDYDPNGPPPGPEFKPTMPAGTVKVDVSDVYDWYKLGQHISNMKGLGKHDFGKGPPSTILSFGDEDTEHKYIQDLEKTGLTTTDIDPVDPNQPKGMKRQKTDPTFNVNETDDRKAAVLKIQKHLNKKYGANLDLDGKLGPLTLQSINKFMPKAKTGLADEPNKTTAVQGKKVKVDEEIADLRVNKNPSPEDLYRLTQRSAHKHMRGMYYNGDTYWWDANDAIHKQGSDYLGIPYDYLSRMEAASDSVRDYYRVAGDNNVPDKIIKKYDIDTEQDIAESDATDIGEKIKNSLGLQQFYVFERGDTIEVSSLIVGKENQGKGLGSKAMLQLIDYADSNNKRITLTPGTKDKTHGTTSRARLVQFYKSLGFKESKGRNLDYAMGAGKMYRDPKSSMSHAVTNEASGYIPSAKEKNDPRFKTALTVDVKPDAIKKNAKAFGFKTSRAGIPPQARADGKIK